MKLLTVGSAIARRGEKVSDFIEVPEAADPATRIPVTVVTGSAGGPVLALTAGIHGSEPSLILALQRVRAELDPSALAGAVIIVHTRRAIALGTWRWHSVSITS